MNIILAGSATGGHIYPAIAIADKIKSKNPDAEILFIGAKKELGSTIVEDNGYKIEYIDIQGINRKNMIKNIAVVKALAVSSLQIRKIFKKFKPDMIIGTGGYVSGPVLKEASRKGIRTYLHEQNAVPGLANKMAQKYADKIFVAFEESIPHFKDPKKVILSGNPIRKGFVTAGILDYRKRFDIGEKDFVVLIFGGSNGAERINEVTVEMLDKIKTRQDIAVFFITGRRQYWEVLNELNEKKITENKKFNIIDYTEVIHEYFAAADIIIGRSGALSVSEITTLGKPSILIPSPNVTGNHQFFNAKPLKDAGAAIIIDEKELTPDLLLNTLMNLMNNRDRLNIMSDASMKIGAVDAINVIYNELDI